ncbi:MAG: hydrogenase iron-sulfur subunit [Euryarchaeota archaeon]|nr:hydrogenase iron-sulfur subunit [Euryarchaeota archaeon]
MLEGAFRALERLSNRAFTTRYSPLQYLGQISVLLLLLLAVSGIYMLPFYRINVEKAYDSVDAITMDVVGGLMRSIHRYAADALVLVLLLHGIKTLVERRLLHGRWVVWVSGVVLLGVVMVEGITGYWMVWDQRAQLVATLTTEFLDVLPIFPKPLAMALATDSGVTNLLFFAVVFVHIAQPLFSMAFVLLHFSRFAKTLLLPPRQVSALVVGSVLLLSIVKPAESAPRAELSRALVNVPVDWFYMFPLPLVQKQPLLLWLLLAGAGAILLLLPRLLREEAEVARVDTDSCVGCGLCYEDCPYGAISMEGEVAQVSPERCACCGTCVGSCNFNAIALGETRLESLKHRIAREVRRGRPFVIMCENCLHRKGVEMLRAAGAGVLPLRCLGMVNPSLITAALDAGASRVVLAGCRAGDCRYRLGNLWLEARVAGERAPAFKDRRRDLVSLCWLMPGEENRLLEEVGKEERCTREEKPMLPLAALLVLATLLPLWYLSTSPAYSLMQEDRAMLLFTMSHLGERLVPCREPTVEELRAGNITPCPRERSPVEVVLAIDGRTVLRKSYQPSGLWNDGPSYAYERIEVEPGEHTLEVRIRDSAEGEFRYRLVERVSFERGRVVTLKFEKGRFHLGDG